VNHPKLTPLLVALTTFNGVNQNYLYGEGTTLHLTGEIRLKGHVPVQIENTVAPTDSMAPDSCRSRWWCKTRLGASLRTILKFRRWSTSLCAWRVCRGGSLLR